LSRESAFFDFQLVLIVSNELFDFPCACRKPDQSESSDVFTRSNSRAIHLSRRSLNLSKKTSPAIQIQINALKSLPGRVVAAVEPTGDYHRPMAYRLLSEGIEVVSISSVALARVREARFGTWDKNDPKDAQVILSMLAQRMVQTYYDPLIAGTHDLQELANTYFQITLTRMRLQHSLLLHYIPLYFPEFARYWNSTRSEWFIRFLLRFPTAEAIRMLEFETFSREAWDLIGRKVAKRAWLAETYAMAAESIGLPVSLESTAIAMFRMQLSRQVQLNLERKQLDQTAQRLLAENADFRRLLTLPGIGAIMALTILAEAGDLRRFGHHRQFLSYSTLRRLAAQYLVTVLRDPHQVILDVAHRVPAMSILTHPLILVENRSKLTA